MASLVQRCRPLLRASSRAVVRGESRSRPRPGNPFSSTATANANRDKKPKPPAATQQEAPRDEGRDQEATPMRTGSFSTGYFKRKGQLHGLPNFLKDNFDHGAAARGGDGEEEDKDEADDDAELELTEDEQAMMDEAEDDIRLIETGELSAQDREHAAQLRRQGVFVPVNDERAPQPLYTRDADGEWVDEEGYPKLQPGESWVDKKAGMTESMLDELESTDYTEEEPPADTSSFFALDEEKDDPDDDPDFEGDDITSMAHLELEQHREVREFYRVIAWDMPLLYNHRKEYKAPGKAQPLRFRYTTYMGESHPASRKVVVDFTPSALPNLTPRQTTKLIKLLGPRYNPEKDKAKMSCELFPNAAQNKRWLGDTLDKLVAEAKNSQDMFEDLPVDLRHHTPRRVIEFPEAWKMTPQRRAYLDGKRKTIDVEQAQGLLPEMQDQSAQTDVDPDKVPILEHVRPIHNSSTPLR